MKSLLLIGGILGFGIGLIFSWAQESPWPFCLWHACLAAYLAALLLRWWGRAWRRNLESVLAANQSQTSPLDISSLSKATKS
jgi:4-amino-4-deoxy-L-arabinose transferase-like glycosyltransferase